MWFDGRVKREVYDNVAAGLRVANTEVNSLVNKLKARDYSITQQEKDIKRWANKCYELECALEKEKARTSLSNETAATNLIEKETLFLGNMMRKILKMIGE